MITVDFNSDEHVANYENEGIRLCGKIKTDKETKQKYIGWFKNDLEKARKDFFERKSIQEVNSNRQIKSFQDAIESLNPGENDHSNNQEID
jgi:ligand-binding sensor protein